MKRVLIINGPNLNLLGKREVEIYGEKDYQCLVEEISKRALELNMEVKIFQSNSEGEIINFIHKNMDWAEGIIINPAGYSTTSVAILDALRSFKGIVVEVHITQIFRREEFRKHLLTARSAHGLICGLGIEGYLLAMEYLKQL